MRQYILYILCLALFLGSCSREDFVGEPDIEEIIPPSEELEVGDVNGIVKGNNGEVIDAAIVQLYNADALVQETITNSLGEFAFMDVFQDDNYRLFVKKAAFNVAISIVSDDNYNSIPLEINLFEDLQSSPFGFPESPLDPNFVVIFGDVTDNDGQGIDAELAMFSQTGVYFQSKVVNGSYATFVPKDESFNLFIYQFVDCPLFPEPILIPALNEDREIDFESTVSLISNSYQGTIIRCDSIEFNGFMEYFVNGEYVTEEISNGVFNIEFDDCNSSFLNYIIYDETGGFTYSGQLNANDSNQDIFIDCDFVLPFDEPITIQLGQNLIQLNVFAYKESSTNDIFIFSTYSEYYLSISFKIESSSTGVINENNIHFQFENEFYTNQEAIPIIYELEEDPAQPNLGLMTFSISGNLLSLVGEEVNIVIEDEIPVIIN